MNVCGDREGRRHYRDEEVREREKETEEPPSTVGSGMIARRNPLVGNTVGRVSMEGSWRVVVIPGLACSLLGLS